MDNFETFEDYWKKFVSKSTANLTTEQLEVMKRVFCLGGLGALGALAHMGSQGLVPKEAIVCCEKIEAEIDTLFHSSSLSKTDH